jgi:imidazolonepropionase-like amidohydrolase
VRWLSAEAAQATHEIIADRIAPSILVRNSDKMKNYDSVLTLAQETSAAFRLWGDSQLLVRRGRSRRIAGKSWRSAEDAANDMRSASQ